MQPQHLELLVSATGPSITPDGASVVVSITRPDLDDDADRGGLWVVPTNGRPARQLTSGNRDTAASVGPDGVTVAFLRVVGGSPPQIYVTRIDGGEPRCLTDQPLGAGAPVWSPDGRMLAWSARVAEVGRYGTKDADGKETSAEAEPPRLVTELGYRWDDLGYTRDRRLHLFVADVPDLSGVPGDEDLDLPIELRQLTDGDADDTEPAWSPDGSTLAFLSSRHATAETDLRTAVHVVDATTDEPVAVPAAVTAGDVSIGGFRWLDDGRLALAAYDVGANGLDFVGRPTQLWISDSPVTKGGGEVGIHVLTDQQAIDIDGGSSGLLVVGGRVIVRDNHRGTVRLLAVDPDGDPTDEPVVVVDGPVVVTGQASSADGATLVVTGSCADRVGDVGVVRNGTVTWLTDTSRRLRDAAGLVEPVEVEATTDDEHRVHGWVMLPDSRTHGEGPHPVLLNIHGGPFAQYTGAFYDEAQVYAGAGYAVVMCNPRGSAGYGSEHGRSIRHAMGTVDADDVLTFLDQVLSDTDLPLDADRVGVMGGSYGGYMTALLTTRTDRFIAAIVERGYLDAVSFVGSSDIGWFFVDGYHGSNEAAVQQSPMTHVDRVTTPTLVIHSEADWRTPIEQGQRWFTALKLQGVETELLVFPAEGHELSRSGRPRHRLARFEHILRWWGSHLPID